MTAYTFSHQATLHPYIPPVGWEARFILPRNTAAEFLGGTGLQGERTGTAADHPPSILSTWSIPYAVALQHTRIRAVCGLGV